MISRWLLTGGWMRELDDQVTRLEAPVLDLAHEILNKRLKKIVRQSKHLDKLEATHRHELRIMIKKLRYSVEFFDGIFPRKTASTRRKALKALTRLQNSLGKLNDIAVDKLDDGILRLPKDDETKTVYAAGMVAGHKQTKVKPLLKKAAKAASDLRKHRSAY
jgi:CHAD domain-containing protein